MPLPSTHVHTLLVDAIPESIPFIVTQSPLCGESLTYTISLTGGGAAPTWITVDPSSFLSLTPSDVSLAGIYSFDLIASEALSGV